VEYVRSRRGEDASGYLCSQCYANLRHDHPDLSVGFRLIQQPVSTVVARSSARRRIK
jgi:hypothetical protein